MRGGARWTSLVRVATALAASALVVAACSGSSDPEPTAQPTAESTVDVDFDVEAHTAASDCEDRFVSFAVDHETRGFGSSETMFDGTGAGLALGDLDGDGDDDLVLANLSGDSSLLWNTGGMDFERHPLIEGRFRQVSIVDFDADDLNDIVLTTGVGRPLVLINTGSGTDPAERFERVEYPDLDAFAYTLGWGDLDGDGDLDVVSGSYNAELTANRQLLLGERAGVVVYTNTSDGYSSVQLTDESQTLALWIGDLDGDGANDIVVGNDLATPDQIWLNSAGGWEAATPFTETAFSTMSFDAGDLDNDGDIDLFATDMKPMDDEPQTLENYSEVHADIEASPTDAIQRPENVLNFATVDGFENQAIDLGLEATGWSWSGLFGDLDNDGLQDIYVVNGMVADNLFAHLPGSALVEPNQAFRNEGDSFAPAPQWDLDHTDGGRGMALADLDGDGDLDIAINNLNSPSRIFENRICGNASVTLRLSWPESGNHAAIGARVEAIGADGDRYLRTVEATRGYLSGASPTVHFGLGPGSEPVDIKVTWPDSEVSTLREVTPGSHLLVTRSEGPQ